MRIVLGAAYERRLDEAVAYLIDVGADVAAQTLLNQAYDALPGRLAQSPRIGHKFVARSLEVPDVLAVWETVCELLGEDVELREYVLGDYLALYAIHGDTLYLLTLRHHRQSGFDFSQA